MRRLSLSVLMPAYNAGNNIAPAIESLLAQTFSDFELIIINDGSTDQTGEIIRRYQRSDPRIRVITHRVNRGVAVARNRGFQAASSGIVAQMDQDDISLPRRFEAQMKYLKKNPDVGLVGTWYENFSSEGMHVKKIPWTHDAILCGMIFDCIVLNSTTMFNLSRISFLPRHNLKYGHAEDYEIFSRMLMRGVRFGIVPEPLVRYRTHPSQITSLRPLKVFAESREIRKMWLEHIGVKASILEFKMHNLYCEGKIHGDTAMLKPWWTKLTNAGLACGLPDTAWRHKMVLVQMGPSKWRHIIRAKKMFESGFSVLFFEIFRHLTIKWREVSFKILYRKNLVSRL